MATNLESRLNVSSPVNVIESAAEKNPLFQKALKQIKSPKERKAFLGMFRNYLTNAYERDPRMQRLMRTHDLSEKVYHMPEIEGYDHRSALEAQLYSETGRTYPYSNNLLGEEREKEGILKRLYNTARDLTFETLPGILGAGGLYAADRWHKGEVSKGVVKRVAESFDKPWYQYFVEGPKSIAIEAAQAMAGESLLGMVGRVLTPAKYLLGGYFLYKTIRYFMDKYNERKELQDINKQVWMQNQMLAERV